MLEAITYSPPFSTWKNIRTLCTKLQLQGYIDCGVVNVIVAVTVVVAPAAATAGGDGAVFIVDVAAAYLVDASDPAPLHVKHVGDAVDKVHLLVDLDEEPVQVLDVSSEEEPVLHAAEPGVAVLVQRHLGGAVPVKALTYLGAGANSAAGTPGENKREKNYERECVCAKIN